MNQKLERIQEFKQKLFISYYIEHNQENDEPLIYSVKIETENDADFWEMRMTDESVYEVTASDGFSLRQFEILESCIVGYAAEYRKDIIESAVQFMCDLIDKSETEYALKHDTANRSVNVFKAELTTLTCTDEELALHLTE